MDSAGNLYIADQENNLIRKVAAGTGIISTVAGNGTAGYSGDGGPATGAELSGPSALAIDSAGNLYIADTDNNVIRKLTAATSVITTVVGTGAFGRSGDGGPALDAELGFPQGIAFDGGDNLYLVDYNDKVREVAAKTGIITTVAGTGYLGYSGDGGPAIDATFGQTRGIAADRAGDLFIADGAVNVIRKVTASNGLISTVAGSATNSYYIFGYSGDGGPATSALLHGPTAVAVDSAGNFYIADSVNGAIRKVTASSGIITTAVGNGDDCNAFGGDGGAATSATLCFPQGISVDSTGNLYISDSYVSRIREATIAGVAPTAAALAPTLSLSAGTYAGPQILTITAATPGSAIYLTLDGSAPTTVSPGYKQPIYVSGSLTVQAIAVAPGYLPSAPVTAAYTITSPPTAVITTVAGDGIWGFSGFGGPATNAQIGWSQGTAVDAAGNLYFSDESNNVICMVSATTGAISVVAGNGTGGYSGDGGPATSAELGGPSGVAVDSSGNLYFADTYNDIVRKVTTSTGLITTVAGVPLEFGDEGDGGPATAAFLSNPVALAFDSAGNFYIATSFSGSVREVSASTGIINTIAGNGSNSFSGDGGPATSAGIPEPVAVAFDQAGNLYIGSVDSGRVRKVTATTGIITTVAGNGNGGEGTGYGDGGDSGDGGPAISAEVYPAGLAVDLAGNLYIADGVSSVREVAASTGLITTVVGNGYGGYFGDGGSATIAELRGPQAIAFDAAGSLYVADSENYRIRKVTLPTPAATPVFSVAAGIYASTQTVTITDSTTGASIYYSTDGSAPATKYTGAITVPSTETVVAIASAPGYATSAVAAATYTIGVPIVAAPTFSPAPGNYELQQIVGIYDATPGASIYYTTNGTNPTSASALYAAPITVSTNQTIKAIALASGDTSSGVVSGVYTIGPIATSGLQFVPVTPCRVADTRLAEGPFGGPEMGGKSSRAFAVPQSACGIPSSAVAYSLNVTVVPGHSLDYLTLWPTGQAQPNVSTLNSDGRIKANAAITPAGTDGSVSIYVSDATQVIIDIDGYFVPAGTESVLAFYPLTPCRVADTRLASGVLGGPFLAKGASRAFPVQSSNCHIPASAQAYSLNVTAIPHTTLDYLTTWPTGQALPNVSTLNSSTGAVAANAAIVPTGAGGDISVFVSDAADVILDVNGYFAPPASGGLSLYTVAPCRVIDTRGHSGAFNGTLAVGVETSACAPASTAQAYVLNATVVPAAPLNYLTLWPVGEALPNVSTLNANDSAITSNMAIVPTLNGEIDAFTSNPTNLILDLSSYFAP